MSPDRPGIGLPRKLLLASEASLMLMGASVAIRLLPSPRVLRLLGRPASPAPASPSPVEPAPARIVGRAVERVSSHMPWQPLCLPQAIATRAMLRRRGIECEGHLGVRRTAPFDAHAWVTVGDVVIQGAPVEGITELAVLR